MTTQQLTEQLKRWPQKPLFWLFILCQLLTPYLIVKESLGFDTIYVSFITILLSVITAMSGLLADAEATDKTADVNIKGYRLVKWTAIVTLSGHLASLALATSLHLALFEPPVQLLGAFHFIRLIGLSLILTNIVNYMLIIFSRGIHRLLQRLKLKQPSNLPQNYLYMWLISIAALTILFYPPLLESIKQYYIAIVLPHMPIDNLSQQGVNVTFTLDYIWLYILSGVASALVIMLHHEKTYQTPWHSPTLVIVPWLAMMLPFIVATNHSTSHSIVVDTVILALLKTLVFISYLIVVVKTLNNRWLQSVATTSSVPANKHQYVDHQQNARAIVKFVEMTASSAVIGITGIRGAGKSALLANVSSQFRSKYRVLQMTAPTTKDHSMAFFTTVCRNLCQEVIEDTKQRLFNDQNPNALASNESRKRLKILITTIAVIVVIITTVYQTKRITINQITDTIAFELLPSRYFNVRDNRRFSQYESALIEHFIVAEQATIRDLLQQLDATIDGSKNNHDEPLRLVWGNAGLGFSITRHKPIANSIRLPATPLFSDQAITEQLLRQNSHNLPYSDPSLFITPAHFVSEQLVLEPALTRYIQFVVNDAIEPPLSRPLYQKISAPTMLYSHLTVVSWEAYLSQSSNLKFEAQQLRAALPPFNHASDHYGRPLHSLFSWIFCEALVQNQSSLTLTVTQWRHIQTILQRYLNLIENSLKPASSNNIMPLSLNFSDFYQPLALTFPSLAKEKNQVLTVTLVLLFLFGRFLWRQIDTVGRMALNPTSLALLRESEKFLDLLSYKASLSQSAGVQHSFFSFNKSVQKQARELSLPGLTAYFARYTQLLAKSYHGKVIIAIDELDKIHNINEVKALLVEIKGALALPNCYFLMTIAEDCSQSFRKRLSGGRDIFESSFDEIIYVSRLSYDSVNQIAQHLVTSHESIATFNEEDCRIVLLFNGGIAREVMRSLHVIITHPELESEHTPLCLAMVLLQKAWQDWLLELAELPVIGLLAGELHAHAYRALSVVRQHNSNISASQLGTIAVRIEQSIALLDPDKQRHEILWSEAHLSEDQQLLAAERLAAFQSLIRLKIMTQLSLWVAQHGSLRNVDESLLLESFKALAQQPSLAEYLLAKISP